MQCDEVHAFLAEKLAGRLADKLSGTVQAYVRMHVLSCPDCCEQLDDFEEMQAMFRRIPMEACDSSAMRSRFKRFIADEEAKAYRASLHTVMAHLSLFPRPLAVAGVTLLVVVAGIFAVTARKTMSPSIAPMVDVPALKPAATTSEPSVEPAVQAVLVPAEPAVAARPDTPSVSLPPPPLPPAPLSADATGGIPISVNLRLDTGERLPYKPDTSIVFTDSAGGFRIPAAPIVGNLFQALVPPNASYSISVSNVASGYAILSISSGTIDLMNGGRISPDASGSAPLKIVVTLRKQ